MKIKTHTDKRFCLGWVETPVSETYHWTPTGAMGHGSVQANTIKGFGGIDYALKAINGEITVDGMPDRLPDLAGIEGGPMSSLNFWFEEE